MSRSVAETFRYTWRTQNVRRLLLRNSMFSFFVAVIPALAPVLILRELRLDASSLGLVFTSMGIGSVLTAFFVLPWPRTRFSTETLMLISQVSLAGIYFLLSIVHHCVYCLLVMGLAGASWTLAASEMWVLVQRALPDTIRGRVSGLMMVLAQGEQLLALSYGVWPPRSPVLDSPFWRPLPHFWPQLWQRFSQENQRSASCRRRLQLHLLRFDPA